MVCFRGGCGCAAEEGGGQRHFGAAEGAREFKHPMVLVPASCFLGMCLEDLEKMHEGPAHDSRLHFIEERREVLALREAGSTILFFSYECLAWGKVGPDAEQLAAMRQSVVEVASLYQLSLDSIFVWLDCLSVPQANRAARQAAISSICLYAAVSDFMIIACPNSVHASTLEKADSESIKRRFWCRLEQVVFGCLQGTGKMHLHRGRELEVLPDGWMDSICCVYESNTSCCRQRHAGFSGCDRETAVTPLLTFFSDVYWRATTSGQATEKDLYAWDLICRHRHRMFPKTFRFTSSAGEQQEEQEEERVLFGSFAQDIERLLPASRPAARQPWGIA